MLSQSARRPFALFTQKWYNADGSKDSHAAEMKRLGQAWRALSDGEKMVYRQQCVQEFQEQNRQLANIGVQRRGVAAEQPNADSAEAAGSQTGKKPQCHGHYQTEGLLGSGSYGKVYYAVSPSTGQPVALKVFPHDSLDMTWELHMCQALCQRLVRGHSGISAQWSKQMTEPSLHGLLMSTKEPVSASASRLVARRCGWLQRKLSLL